MSAVRITDAAGQTYSIDGCDTISQLKDAILEHTGIPVEQQHLTRSGDSRELRDGDEVSADEELEMLVDLSGGCEVKPFFIKIQNFECQFRCMCFYSGIDLNWSKCQYCCVHAGANF